MLFDLGIVLKQEWGGGNWFGLAGSSPARPTLRSLPQQGSPPPGRSIAGGAHQGSPFREWMDLAPVAAGGKRNGGPRRHSPCRLRNGTILLVARSERVRRGGGRDHRGSDSPPLNWVAMGQERARRQASNLPAAARGRVGMMKNEGRSWNLRWEGLMRGM